MSSDKFDDDNPEIYAIANPGYEFLYWITDAGEHILENPLKSIKAGVEVITAIFAKPMEPNNVCILDSMLISGINASTFEVSKLEGANLSAMGTASIINYTTKTGLSMVHVWATPNIGYEFACWAVVDENGNLIALRDSVNGGIYGDACDIEVSKVKDKVLVACFKAI